MHDRTQHNHFQTTATKARHTRAFFRRGALYAGSLLALAWMSGCVASESTGTGIDPNAQNEQDQMNAEGMAGTSGALDGPMLNLGGTQMNSTLTEADVCETVTVEAARVPVDMYIMLDQSVSMAEMAGTTTRWDAVTGALTSFINDSRSAGLGVGINYFGVGFDSVENCVVSNYSTPDVEIGDLPGNATALVNSINSALGPASSSRTPTSAALDGALQHAVAHAQDLAANNSERGTVVVLASDGFPTECDTALPTLTGLAQAAAEGDPPVRTYVIAIAEGASNAEQIAEAGQGRSFTIDGTADVESNFLEAMFSVASDTLSCSYDLPEIPAERMEKIDPSRVEFGYQSAATGETELLAEVADRGGCAGDTGDGFFYDVADNPTAVILCPKTCSRLGAGTVNIKFACNPVGGVQ